MADRAQLGTILLSERSIEHFVRIRFSIIVTLLQERLLIRFWLFLANYRIALLVVGVFAGILVSQILVEAILRQVRLADLMPLLLVELTARATHDVHHDTVALMT